METGKPSREELIKYWTLQRYLGYCHKQCKKEPNCWTNDREYLFRPEIMLKACPYKNMRKAIVLLNDISKNYGPLAFTLTGENRDEIMRIVEEKMKEKVIRI